jgi:hypothetical protein
LTPSFTQPCADYQRFTDRIRTLQRNLITAHISLLSFDEQDTEIFRDDILPPTRIAFARLRRDIDLTIREIGEALGVGPMFIEATQSGYLECLDRERAAALAAKMPQLERTVSGKTAPAAEDDGDEQEESNLTSDDIAGNLFNVSKRLQMEMGTETPVPEDAPSTPTQANTTVAETTAIGTPGAKEKGSPISPKSPLPAAPTVETSKGKYGPAMMRAHFEEFEAIQKDVLVDILTSSDPGGNTGLKIHEPGPSVSELYGGDYLRGDVEEGDLPDLIAKRRKASKNMAPRSIPPLSVKSEGKSDEENPSTPNEELDVEVEVEDDHSSAVGPTPQFRRNQTLVRVYSLLFAWEYVFN